MTGKQSMSGIDAGGKVVQKSADHSTDQKMEGIRAQKDVKQILGSSIDLNILAADLARLRMAMKTEGTTTDDDVAVGQIALAETAAKSGDKERTIEHLKAAGMWAFDVAKKIGVEVAASALKQSLGIL